jgi:SAM-dependent methyltransferase
VPAVDRTTLSFYGKEAEAYATREREASTQLDLFLAALPSGASILELGCGGGHDSEVMIGRGFDVVPTDGTPELALEAQKRLGREVQVVLFQDLDAQEAFDGVWANACLLHVPRAELSGILGRIQTALRSGGLFYASFKSGEGEGRDALERYNNYPSLAWLRETYAALSWQQMDISEDVGSGFDGKPTSWIHVIVRKR